MLGFVLWALLEPFWGQRGLRPAGRPDLTRLSELINGISHAFAHSYLVG